MAVVKDETHAIHRPEDIVLVRRMVREWTIACSFNLVDQTKMVTAASELARNTLEHGHGGNVRLELLNDNQRRGLRLVFEDQGPGIPDIERALRDGFTSANGLGLGLGGARRLCNEFELSSTPGEGTRVAITRWK